MSSPFSPSSIIADYVSAGKGAGGEHRCEDMVEASLSQWRSLIVVSGSPYR